MRGELCNLFRFDKRKNMFMKTNMMRDKCVKKRCQDNDNQDEKSYSLKTHMKRNKNLIYDYDRDAEMENKDI